MVKHQEPSLANQRQFSEMFERQTLNITVKRNDGKMDSTAECVVAVA